MVSPSMAKTVVAPAPEVRGRDGVLAILLKDCGRALIKMMPVIRNYLSLATLVSILRRESYRVYGMLLRLLPVCWWIHSRLSTYVFVLHYYALLYEDCDSCMVLYSDNFFRRTPCLGQPGTRNDKYDYDENGALTSDTLGSVTCQNGDSSDSKDQPNMFNLHRNGKLIEWSIGPNLVPFWRVSTM